MGVAGTGKTLVMRCYRESLHREPLPTVLVFGELLQLQKNHLNKLFSNDLKLSKEQFLQLLNEAGKIILSCSSIDALNETRQSNFGKNLNKVIIEIKIPRYRIRLARTGFEDSDKNRGNFLYEEHKGFNSENGKQ